MGLETRPPPEGGPAPGASAPLEDGTESRPPEPKPPASDLPPIAAKADDLEAIKKAVDDAASVGGGLWLSYLFVLFYLAVAGGAVTHADLFLEKPVKLPFLNVELPLLAFFFVAPILFLFVHAYTLVHLVFLTDKAKRFDQALSAQIGDDSAATTYAGDPRIKAIAGVRGQLPSNIFIQFLAGPRDRRAGSFGWLLRLIAWSTLAVAPILLLLLFQLQFLPFHNNWITWTHRLALTIDLALIWWLWRKIIEGREMVAPRPRAARWWRGLGAFLTGCCVLFSLVVATFPGEWQDSLPSLEIFPKMVKSRARSEPEAASFRNRIASYIDWVWSSEKVSLRDWIFSSRVDEVTRRRVLPISNTLVLTGFNIYEGLNIDDPDKVKGRNWVFRARGRDLKGAIFDLAILPKVDFKGAKLEAARLESTDLPDTRLDDAELQGASLARSRLRGASLSAARLEGASLSDAELQGASLAGAQLQGASLVGAKLQGARLDCEALGDLGEMCVQLQGASLQYAQLQGASLANAQLQGASLEGAQLQGASLEGAQLQGASLQAAVLDVTDLSTAWLWRTNAEAPSGAAKPRAVRLSSVSWSPSSKGYFSDPHTWEEQAYEDLRKSIEDLPAGMPRNLALNNIGRLDCASPDETLASCNPNLANSPPGAAAWRQILEAAAPVDDEAYALALAKVLKELVCSGDDEAVYVVRGLGFRRRLLAAGSAAFEVIDELTSKDGKNCPVAAKTQRRRPRDPRAIREVHQGKGGEAKGELGLDGYPSILARKSAEPGTKVRGFATARLADHDGWVADNLGNVAWRCLIADPNRLGAVEG